MTRILTIMMLLSIATPAISQSQSFKKLYSGSLSEYEYLEGQCQIMSGDHGTVIGIDKNDDQVYDEYHGLWADTNSGIDRPREDCQIIYSGGAIIYYSSTDQYSLLLRINNDEFDKFWALVPADWEKKIGMNIVRGIGIHQHSGSNYRFNTFTGSE